MKSVLLAVVLLIVSGSAFAGWKVNHAVYPTPAGACYSTKVAACDAVVLSGAATHTSDFADGASCRVHFDNGSSQVVSYSACDESCPAGQERNTSTGQCEAPLNCPPGYKPNASNTQCVCPLRDPATGQCRQDCSGMQGASEQIHHAFTGQTGINQYHNGCHTQCIVSPNSYSINGINALYLCTYSGQTAAEQQGVEEGSEETPQGPPTPPGEEAPDQNDPESCPSGTKPGYVNGELYCAPYEPEAAPEEPNPTENDPTGLGPKFDDLGNRIDQVKQQIATSGNEQSVAITGALKGIEAAIKAQGPNVGGGGGDGDGEGPGDGAGTCDPEAADYALCIGMTEEIADGQAEQLKTDADAAADVIVEDFELAANQYIDDLVETPPESPDQLKSFVSAVLPQPTGCTQMTLNFPGGHNLALPCERFDFLKQLFGWALALMTTIYIFKLATEPTV